MGTSPRGLFSDRVDPPLLQPRLHVGGARETPDQQGRSFVVAPQPQNVAHMRIGSPRLGEQIVAIAPPGHQAQITYRRERGRARAHHAAHVPPQHLQPGRVPGLRPLISGQPHVLVVAQHAGEGRVDPLDVAAIRHHDDHPTPRGKRRLRGVSESNGPVECRIVAR